MGPKMGPIQYLLYIQKAWINTHQTKTFAMQILAQKVQELAAEGYFSLIDNVQSKNRGKMQAGSLEKQRLFCSEVLQEIAECANEAINHNLQTVDKAQQPPPPPITPTP